MKVNEWFSSGADYNTGVLLYASLKGYNPNLVRLFLKKESPSNLEKLKYELGKFKTKEKVKITKPLIVKNEKNPQSNIDIKINGRECYPKTNTQNFSFYFYRLNELHVDLHPLSQKQRANFQKAISLKLQLNEKHKDEEGVSLALCIEIEGLFDAIETAQKVLKHYVEHKVVLNIAPRNYSFLTPAQLIQSRNNKRISISKYKKKIKSFENDLRQNLSKSEATKKRIVLEKAKSKLLEHELDLQLLNELINKASND
ncbi:hypothetical protein V2647_03665 [Tenacibaculum maritimum]|uniref:hypothetical protein n=1 Tax=Tenacibaculum maritimum TaxID=107401 RepID=UPI0012E6CD6E|nr:hypothetical protein [Tenacibaculum maritimum]CAA0150082.1 conserved hypothetical protein [Tenacibaculum maritimum]